MSTDKVRRVVDVLEYVLSRRATGVRLSDIVAEFDSPLSSTHALLKSMTGAGLLTVDAERFYRIGPRFMRLALSADGSFDVRAMAHPILERLAADLSHDVYLAIRVGDAVVYVDRIPGRGRAAVDIRLGEPISLHSTAAGKLYCAYSADLQAKMLEGDRPAFTANTMVAADAVSRELRVIRERGFSVSNEESITGIVGLALPLWSRDRKSVV